MIYGTTNENKFFVVKNMYMLKNKRNAFGAT
jgi:hypothetical protein